MDLLKKLDLDENNDLFERVQQTAPDTVYTRKCRTTPCLRLALGSPALGFVFYCLYITARGGISIFK